MRRLQLTSVRDAQCFWSLNFSLLICKHFFFPRKRFLLVVSSNNLLHFKTKQNAWCCYAEWEWKEAREFMGKGQELQMEPKQKCIRNRGNHHWWNAMNFPETAWATPSSHPADGNNTLVQNIWGAKCNTTNSAALPSHRTYPSGCQSRPSEFCAEPEPLMSYLFSNRPSGLTFSMSTDHCQQGCHWVTIQNCKCVTI